MAHVVPLTWALVGLALLDGSMHLPIPPAARIALLLMLHGSRLLPALTVPPVVWLAAAAIVAIGERASSPASGSA
jgi:hypothetical protein